MPIYDYHCDHCEHSFSAVQSYNDGPIEKCPNCGKRPRRLFTVPAIHFKGSGWYKTDSRRGSDKSESKSEKTETKTETKSEAKPSKPPPKTEAAS